MHAWCAGCLWLALLPAFPAPLEVQALVELRALAPAEAGALLDHLLEVAGRAERELRPLGACRVTRELVLAQVVARLADRRQRLARGEDLPRGAGDLRRTVLDFEAWKLVRFVRSGVFPKRYFGYLDRRNDTAALEGRLRDITRRVVAVSNAYQAERGHPVRISDLEVVVTFLAEGGAILLRERQDLLGRLHPVFEVGLDDVALGFSDLPGLQARIDREAGTDLQGLVGWADTQVAALAAEGPVPRHLRLLKHPHGDGGPHAYLRRFMTFEEAVAGTALMYLWEKEIAARKLLNQGLPPLERRSLEEQFVIASLVYNSGRLHVPERWRQIQAAATAAWLVAVSDRNAPERPRLDVTLPAEALAGLCAGQGYPEQPTSWVAVYHVLQRHGAFVALRNFSDHFDDSGFFRAGETGTE